MVRSRVGGRGAAGRGCARHAPHLVRGVLGVWWRRWARWAGRCTEGVAVHLELPQTPARKSGWVAMPSGCGCGCGWASGCGCGSDGRCCDAAAADPVPKPSELRAFCTEWEIGTAKPK
eukprot:COSAG06_NODE_3420_length_5370_cov_22.772149_3_plen_118_part_00